MIAQTNYGQVRGKKNGRFYEFLGIPFAKSPAGKLRWKAPEAPDKWEGVYDATEYGYQSIQNNNLGNVTGKGISEDCLNLNVFTPGLDDKKRPVVIMYSGGGCTNGGNNNPIFNGNDFCKDREVIMVYANFRLGMLGFLYLGHILGEEYQASGSCGLMDQIFALKWVKENIQYFGGDPDNITIMGQSAGGKSVCNMTLSPLADGMYNKVIAMSGANQVIRDLETSRVITDRFLELVGIKKEEAYKLFDIPADEILKMQEKYYSTYSHVTGPVYDGVVLPLVMNDSLKEGSKEGISVLIGHAADEFDPMIPTRVADDEACRKRLNVMYGISGDHVFDVYCEYRKTMPKYMAWGKIMTQYNYGDGALRFASELTKAGATVWSYRWDYLGYFRATHSSDLAFVCGFAEEKDKPKPKNFDYVCKLMNDTFLNFIEYGNPQTEDTMDWKPYTNSENGTRMYLSDYPSAEPFSLENYDHDFPDSQLILKEKGTN